LFLFDGFTFQIKYHFLQDQFLSYGEALDCVRQGNAWAAIYIGKSFTVDTIQRLCSSSGCPFNPFNESATNDTINGSSIHIQRDLSSECKLECYLAPFISSNNV